MDNTKANLDKDEKFSTKLFGPLTNYRKQKLKAKVELK